MSKRLFKNAFRVLKSHKLQTAGSDRIHRISVSKMAKIPLEMLVVCGANLSDRKG